MNKIKSLFNKLINNPTLMSWSAYFVQFGSGLIVLPLILTNFDKEDQSFWFLIGTIRGFAMLADIGFGNVIIRAVAYFNSGMEVLPKNLAEFNATEKKSDEPNIKGLAELLKTLKVIYVILAVIVFVLLATAGILTVWNLFNLAGHPVYLWVSYILIAASTVVYILTVMWQNFINGLNYVARVYRFGTFMGLIRITVFTALLLAGYGVEYLSFYILLDSLITLLYYRRFISRWFKKFDINPVNTYSFNKTVFNSIWPVTWKTGGTQWGNYLLDNGTSIVAAQIQNVGLMASFLFTQRIFHLIRRTSEAPFYSHIPVIYNLMANKNYKALKEKASTYIFLSMGILISALLITGFFGNSLLNLVNIDTEFAPPLIFAVMAVSMLIQVHATFHGSIFVSTNSIPYMWQSVVSGAVLVGAGYFIVETGYGLLGLVVLQLIILISYISWIQIKLSLNLLDWPLSNYLKDVTVYGLKFIRHILRK